MVLCPVSRYKDAKGSMLMLVVGNQARRGNQAQARRSKFRRRLYKPGNPYQNVKSRVS